MIKFGTGGWRDVIADGFTRENLRLITTGLCEVMAEDANASCRVCVGYDRRFLSKESAHWACEVLAGYGFKPLFINRSSPTPLAMYTVRKMNFPYGMMITASHNPAVYNGVKVFTAGGRDAEAGFTARIEEKANALNPADVASMDYDLAVQKGLIVEDDTSNDYIDGILSSIDTAAIRNARLRIALDPMYGVSQSCLSTVLMTCRCDLEVIHSQHDTLFGGHLPAPEKERLGLLTSVVTDRHGCNIGIATDGDADRVGVIDDTGTYVHPNRLLVLLYYYLVKYRGWTGDCVRNNSTTHMLDRVAQSFGHKCWEVPVGFKHISSKMLETDAIIGGESSGGLAVRGNTPGKDGIYAAALLVEMLAVTGKSLSELYKEVCQKFGTLYYTERNYSMTPARKAELQTRIFDACEMPDFGAVPEKISREDGCKLYFADGSWVICRFSGTEPLLRVCAEAQTQRKADALAQKCKEFFKL